MPINESHISLTLSPGPGPLQFNHLPVMAPKEDRSVRQRRDQARKELMRKIGSLGVSIAEEDCDAVRTTLDELKRCLSEIEALHEELVGDSPTTKDDSFLAAVRSSYIEAVKEGRALLKAPVAQEQVSAADERQKATPSVDEPALAKALRYVNLPQISLPQFNGDPLAYWPFLRAFDSCIDKEGIGNDIKLTQLLQCCSGKARRAIECCAMLTNGYEKARHFVQTLWKLLLHR